MGADEIIKAVIILVVAMIIFSYIFNTEARTQINNFFSEMGNKISTLGTSSNISNSNFRCEDELKGWLRVERTKLSSGESIEIIEEKSFANKTELLNYVEKWGSYNEYEIKKDIEEITKIEEEPINVTTQLKQEENIITLAFEYSPEDVEYVRLEVKKWFFNKNPEIVCDKISDSPKGKLECNTSEFGEGNYDAKSYIQEVEKEPKFWEGRIDLVLIKYNKKYYTGVSYSALYFGICEELGKFKIPE